jgi:glucosylceramidase
VLDDPEARKYVANVPYHGYDRGRYDQIVAFRKRYPDLALWMTEVCHAYEAGYRETAPKLPRYDYEDGDHWGNMIFSDIEAGASAWTYWNMILDQTGGPWAVSPIHGNPDPNSQHPVVIVNRKTHEVTYTALYYYLTHFSRFVRPGAVRVAVDGTVAGLRCLAFRSPDGRLVAEVLNSGDASSSATLSWNGRTLALNLPARSISTYLWQ